MYHTYLSLARDESMSNTSAAGAARKKNMGTGASQTQAKKKHSEVMGGRLTDAYTAPSPRSSATASAYSTGIVTRTSNIVLNRSVSERGRGLTRTSNIERESVVFPNDLKKNDNLKFYRNEMKSKPFPGTKFKDMMGWKGDFHKLEYEHQYIQWLFPLPEGKGLNYSAQPLQEHEAIAIQADSQTRLNVLRAYRMMLDFYGMELVSSDSGEVTRSKNYIERFEHLNRSMHNYRRITRIIKSLGCLGFGHLQAPWVKFIINEALIERTLPRLNGGSMYHWIYAIADTKEREDTLSYFLKLRVGSDVDFTENGFDMAEHMDYDVGGNVDLNNDDRVLSDGGQSVDRGHAFDIAPKPGDGSVHVDNSGGSVHRREVDNGRGIDKVHERNSEHNSNTALFDTASETATYLGTTFAPTVSVVTSINDPNIDPTCKSDWNAF